MWIGPEGAHPGPEAFTVNDITYWTEPETATYSHLGIRMSAAGVCGDQWSIVIDSLQRKLRRWSLKLTSLTDKVAITNTLLHSATYYLGRQLLPSKADATRLKSLTYLALGAKTPPQGRSPQWQGVPLRVLTRPRSAGGLNLNDLTHGHSPTMVVCSLSPGGPPMATDSSQANHRLVHHPRWPRHSPSCCDSYKRPTDNARYSRRTVV